MTQAQVAKMDKKQLRAELSKVGVEWDKRMSISRLQTLLVESLKNGKPKKKTKKKTAAVKKIALEHGSTLTDTTDDDDGLESSAEKCVACAGSGKSTKGKACRPCQGTGYKGKKKPKRARKSSGKPMWPIAWIHNKDLYWKMLIGGSRPKEDAIAIPHLMKAIDERVLDFSPTTLESGGIDCLGLHFDDKSKTCVEWCPHGMLCEQICKRRPELATMVENMAEAQDEADEIGEKELRAMTGEMREAHMEALKKKKAEESTTEEKTTKKKTKKKAKVVKKQEKVSTYMWVSKNLRAYKKDEDTDPAVLSIMEWAAGRKVRGFTYDQFFEQVEKVWEEAEEEAQGFFDWLVENGDIKEKTQ